jgi:hypothetical protein
MGTGDFVNDMAGLGMADIFHLAIWPFLKRRLLPRKDGSLFGFLLLYALLLLEWLHARLRHVWHIKTHLKFPESRF